MPGVALAALIGLIDTGAQSAGRWVCQYPHDGSRRRCWSLGMLLPRLSDLVEIKGMEFGLFCISLGSAALPRE
jgi:hypothetical protein